MFGFKASFAAAFSRVTNIFFRAFAVPLLAEAVSKIQGIKSLGGEKSKGYDAKTQYRPAQVMVVYERDIFNLFAQLGQNGIIDHKINVLLQVFRKFNGFKYLAIGLIHKRSPTIVRILFESIKGILLSRRPLQPMLLAKAMNGFHLQ
jgi:hypothetical protein